tara:strand:+ start:155 stop:793 length:639 start_codon:yes stop_codon:yes gene_type:complete
MEALMSLSSKITCSFIILSSFLLIFVTGRSNIKNFEKVRASIQEIYEDRLVVEGLIYELSTHLHQKEIAVISGDMNFFAKTNPNLNEKIEKTLIAFRNTKLTSFEDETLNEFSEGISELKAIEKKSRAVEEIELTAREKKDILKQIKVLQDNLKTLLEIQLEEGRRKLSNSNDAVNSMYQYESFENYAIIILAILLLGIVFIPGYRNKAKAG